MCGVVIIRRPTVELLDAGILAQYELPDSSSALALFLWYRIGCRC